MQLNKKEYYKTRGDLKLIPHLNSPSTSIATSEGDKIVKIINFSTKQDFDHWFPFLLEEIEKQNKLYQEYPNLLLKIVDYCHQHEGPSHTVYLSYEQEQSQSIFEKIKGQIVQNNQQLIRLAINIIEIGIMIQRSNVSHNNIKPTNLIYCNGKVLLTDYGSQRTINRNYVKKYTQQSYANWQNQFQAYQCEAYLKTIAEEVEFRDENWLQVFEQQNIQADIWALGIVILQLFEKDPFNIPESRDNFYGLNKIGLQEKIKLLKQKKLDIIETVLQSLLINNQNIIEVHETLLKNLQEKAGTLLNQKIIAQNKNENMKITQYKQKKIHYQQQNKNYTKKKETLHSVEQEEINQNLPEINEQETKVEQNQNINQNLAKVSEEENVRQNDIQNQNLVEFNQQVTKVEQNDNISQPLVEINEQERKVEQNHNENCDLVQSNKDKQQEDVTHQAKIQLQQSFIDFQKIDDQDIQKPNKQIQQNEQIHDQQLQLFNFEENNDNVQNNNEVLSQAEEQQVYNNNEIQSKQNTEPQETFDIIKFDEILGQTEECPLVNIEDDKNQFDQTEVIDIQKLASQEDINQEPPQAHCESAFQQNSQFIEKINEQLNQSNQPKQSESLEVAINQSDKVFKDLLTQSQKTLSLFYNKNYALHKFFIHKGDINFVDFDNLKLLNKNEAQDYIIGLERKKKIIEDDLVNLELVHQRIILKQRTILQINFQIFQAETRIRALQLLNEELNIKDCESNLLYYFNEQEVKFFEQKFGLEGRMKNKLEEIKQLYKALEDPSLSIEAKLLENVDIETLENYYKNLNQLQQEFVDQEPFKYQEQISRVKAIIKKIQNQIKILGHQNFQFIFQIQCRKKCENFLSTKDRRMLLTNDEFKQIEELELGGIYLANYS